MLGRRLASAAVIISAMLILIWFDFQLGTSAWLSRPGLILGLFAIIVSGLAAGELTDLLQDDQNQVPIWLPVSATVAMVSVNCAPFLWSDYPANCQVGILGWSMAGLTLACVITFAYEMQRFGNDGQNGRALNRLCRCFFSYAYLQMFFAFIVGHRVLSGDNAFGLFAMILLMATVKLSDAMAYFVGKSFGKTKVAPKLSPKKTLEGVFGAILGGIGGAAIMVFVIAPFVFQLEIDKPYWWFLVYGILVTLAGMVGDLAESMIKREADAKDSSKWLPGLGGILDIADSLVFAAPVSYFLLV